MMACDGAAYSAAPKLAMSAAVRILLANMVVPSMEEKRVSRAVLPRSDERMHNKTVP